jgi:hypothetical protein
MAERELIPALPATVRQQMNWDLRDKFLAALDDNARFIVRRMIAKAYATGYDDGMTAGSNDAHTDAAIERDRTEADSGSGATQ